MGIFNLFKPKPDQSPPTAQNELNTAASQLVKKVLIVEDEKMIADALTEVFTSEGFMVLTAENGQIGLTSIQTQRPDIVLLDLMMPVMDGKTMLMNLRKIPEFKSLPVIVLTNAGDADSMHATKLFGNANEFLIKSNVNMDELVQKVRMHLNTFSS